MVVGSAFLSTLAMGLFLLVIFVTVSLAGQRREFDRPRLTREESPLSVLAGPVGWTLGFLVVALVLGVGAIVVVSDGGFIPGLGGELQPLVLGGLSGLLGVYVLLGTYYAARARGAPSALAAGLSAGIVGFVVLGVITLRLVGYI